jgi:hypothetical protein
MTSYIFQKIAQGANTRGLDLKTKTREAISWFRTTASNVRNVNNERLLNDPKNQVGSISSDSIGKMYSFFYDPKHKETLPYYDTFPLVIVIGPKGNNGFLGLNLHYLPPVLRARLMDNLYQTLNNKKFDSTTKMKINYELLSGASRFRYFKPCVKHYLFDHVKSKYLEIEPRFWDIALMLPTETFVKEEASDVWNISRRQVI